MISNIKNLSIRRRRMLLGFSFGFGFSFIAVFLNILSLSLSDLTRLQILFFIIGFLGWLVWIYYLIRILNLQQSIKSDPEQAAALNDEYIESIRRQSICIAFWVLLVSQGILFLVNMFYPLSAQVVIMVNVFIAAMAVVISFMLLDRE